MLPNPNIGNIDKFLEEQRKFSAVGSAGVMYADENEDSSPSSATSHVVATLQGHEGIPVQTRVANIFNSGCIYSFGQEAIDVEQPAVATIVSNLRNYLSDSIKYYVIEGRDDHLSEHYSENLDNCIGWYLISKSNRNLYSVGKLTERNLFEKSFSPTMLIADSGG